MRDQLVPFQAPIGGTVWAPTDRRRLVKHDKSLGARIKELISIVSYSTFRKWVRELEDTPDNRPKPKDAKPGRPRVEESVSDAIIRTRKETAWGYTKIVQAIRRLGRKILRQTVKNVLTEAGLGPEPQDHPDTPFGVSEAPRRDDVAV